MKQSRYNRNTKISSLRRELSVRTFNALSNSSRFFIDGNYASYSPRTIGDLLGCSRADILKLKNFGKKCLYELIEFLDENHIEHNFRGLSTNITAEEIRMINERYEDQIITLRCRVNKNNQRIESLEKTIGLRNVR